jgi:hypothetical protein
VFEAYHTRQCLKPFRPVSVCIIIYLKVNQTLTGLSDTVRSS